MPNDNILRRSNRQHVPTTRARFYNKQREVTRPLFPSVGDDIAVKWLLNKRSIWWPATILSVENNSSTKKKVADILYHKYEDYPPVKVHVYFTASSSGQRFVISHGCNDSSSWVFSDECSSSDGESIDESRESSPKRSSKHIFKKGKRESSEGTSTQLERNGKRALSDPPNSNIVKKRLSSGQGSSSAEHHGGSVHPFNNEEEKNVSDSNKINGSIKEDIDIGIRVQLLERKLQDSPMSRSSSLTTSAKSVIVSLRWALLKALEKPLKRLNLPGISEHGLASHEVSVSSECDYYTFREISAALAKEHRFSSLDPKKSRVAFSPAFHITQSGSSASTNLSILFSSLADLTAFLQIRDDKDYETILSKEVLSPTSTLLRLVGTFIIEENPQSHRPTECGSGFTKSVSVFSSTVPIIKLFIGSSPLEYQVSTAQTPNHYVGGNLEEDSLGTYVIKQECKHFCLSSKSYRTPWKCDYVESKHLMNSTFHLDGTVPDEEHKDYFVLNWSRQQAPSTMKWTRDVHDAGNNSPGCLRLSVPTVLFSSSRNVNALVSKLDTHIEAFMRIRSTLHSWSSFK